MCSSDLEVSRADLKLAREMGMLVSLHVGGGRMLTPDGFPRLLAEGLIDDRVNIVHGNSIDFETLRGITGAGGTVTVTPDIELQMGYGDCLTGPLRRLGARPSLGVDIECLIGGDMFTVMRVALQALRHADSLAARRETGMGPAHVTVAAREALEWATNSGAAMVGLEHRVGSLTPGKQADIVLLDADALNLFPVTDPVAAIVLHAGIANVETVLVAGRVVKRAGKLLYPDLPRRKAQLAEASRRIVSTVMH